MGWGYGLWVMSWGWGYRFWVRAGVGVMGYGLGLELML